MKWVIPFRLKIIEIIFPCRDNSLNIIEIHLYIGNGFLELMTMVRFTLNFF